MRSVCNWGCFVLAGYGSVIIKAGGGGGLPDGGGGGLIITISIFYCVSLSVSLHRHNVVSTYSVFLNFSYAKPLISSRS